ncbi:MAG: hypothetical protein BJ554DRAFT_3828, partial [Olpidium bornovanus]
PTLRVLFPRHDWTNPDKAQLIINSGARGGIWGHQFVYVHALPDAFRLLWCLLKDRKKLFLPTSTVEMMDALGEFVEANFPDLHVMRVSRYADAAHKEGLAGPDPAAFLREEGVDVLIATPVLSTGFSIAGGLFDTEIGFFTIPYTFTARQFVDAARAYDTSVDQLIGGLVAAIPDTKYRWYAALREAEAMVMERMGAGRFVVKLEKVTAKKAIPLSVARIAALEAIVARLSAENAKLKADRQAQLSPRSPSLQPAGNPSGHAVSDVLVSRDPPCPAITSGTPGRQPQQPLPFLWCFGPAPAGAPALGERAAPPPARATPFAEVAAAGVGPPSWAALAIAKKLSSKIPRRRAAPQASRDVTRIYVAIRKGPLSKIRDALRTMGISPRQIPEIRFVGKSLAELWVYS